MKIVFLLNVLAVAVVAEVFLTKILLIRNILMPGIFKIFVSHLEKKVVQWDVVQKEPLHVIIISVLSMN